MCLSLDDILCVVILAIILYLYLSDTVSLCICMHLNSCRMLNAEFLKNENLFRIVLLCTVYVDINTILFVTCSLLFKSPESLG